MNNLLNNLKEIATAVMYAAEGHNEEQVLERIAHISRDLVKTRYAALGIPDGEGGLRYFKVSGMSSDEIAQMEHLPRGRGLLGAIMTERKPIRLENMREDERSYGFCRSHPPMTSFLGVPIQMGQQLFGMLYLCDKVDGQPFNEADEWLVETMAGYAALAIAGSALSEQKNRLTILEERERIGMELHDGVIQSLYALGMHLDLLRTGDSPIEAENLTPIIAGLNEVIEDIRRYILNLKARSFHKNTIRECIQDMLNRLHIPRSVEVNLDAPDDYPPFSPVIFEAICQITNEALSNAVRHADATRIQVTVPPVVHNFQVIIEDNGLGFELQRAWSENGLGLRNIQRRAQMHGGSVDIQTERGKGTILTITIPL